MVRVGVVARAHRHRLRDVPVAAREAERGARPQGAGARAHLRGRGVGDRRRHRHRLARPGRRGEHDIVAARRTPLGERERGRRDRHPGFRAVVVLHRDLGRDRGAERVAGPCGERRGHRPVRFGRAVGHGRHREGRRALPGLYRHLAPTLPNRHGIGSRSVPVRLSLPATRSHAARAPSLRSAGVPNHSWCAPPFSLISTPGGVFSHT